MGNEYGKNIERGKQEILNDQRNIIVTLLNGTEYIQMESYWTDVSLASQTEQLRTE